MSDGATTAITTFSVVDETVNPTTSWSNTILVFEITGGSNYAVDDLMLLTISSKF